MIGKNRSEDNETQESSFSEPTVENELEKGDITAVILSSVVMFALPFIGITAAASVMVYFFFIR